MSTLSRDFSTRTTTWRDWVCKQTMRFKRFSEKLLAEAYDFTKGKEKLLKLTEARRCQNLSNWNRADFAVWEERLTHIACKSKSNGAE